MVHKYPIILDFLLFLNWIASQEQCERCSLFSYKSPTYVREMILKEDKIRVYLILNCIYVEFLFETLWANGRLSTTNSQSHTKEHNLQQQKTLNTTIMVPPTSQPPAAPILKVSTIAIHCKIDINSHSTWMQFLLGTNFSFILLLLLKVNLWYLKNWEKQKNLQGMFWARFPVTMNNINCRRS